MTQLTNLMIFLIAMKFQFIHTQFIGKDDYFNHKQYDLPEFLVDKSLFTTEKQDFQNPPWITQPTQLTNKVKTDTESTSSVTVTFEAKIKSVQPTPTTGEIRSNNNNETNTILTYWSRLQYAPSIKPTTEASTIFTTTSTTESTTRSTINYTTKSTPKLTTKPTSRPTTKITTRSTTTTRKVLTTSTPIRITSLLIKTLVPLVPIQTKTTIPWVIYLSPKTKKTNNITSEATGTATGTAIGTVTGTTTGTATGTATGTVTATSTGTSTKTSNKITVTHTPTENLYFEAKFNKIRPKNPTIATLPVPIVFQDLTMIRSGIPEDEKPVAEFIDEINQATTQTVQPEIALIDKRAKARNSLREKETIDYRELTTEPFSKFLELLMQRLAAMDSTNAAKFFRTFEAQMGVLLSTGRVEALGPATVAYILKSISAFHQFPVDHRQRLLSMVSDILANRNDTLGPELNSLLDYMDMLYSIKAEVHMERVLNETRAYPNISKTAEEITEGFLEDVILNPLKRLSGTTQGNKLLAAIADIISNKKSNFNARRANSRKHYQYPKRYKKVKVVNNFRKTKSKRPKSEQVLTNKFDRSLFSDEYGRVQTTKRTEKDRNRMVIDYRNSDGNITNFLISSNTEEENVSSSINKNVRTKHYTLNLVNKGHEIRNDKRKLSAESKNSDSNEKMFRASFNKIRQSKNIFNPFRTVLYKDNNNRFDNSYTDKKTYEKHFQRTTRTTKATKQSVTPITSRHKNKENYTFGIQPSKHEPNMDHKQKVKYNKEADKEKIKNIVRQSIKSEPNSYHKTESQDSDITSDIELTTTTTRPVYKPKKVKEVKLTQNSSKLPKSIDKNKFETTREEETTQTELKKANKSLKHYYFKPVIMQNKSRDDDEFIAIEFDGEPNVIDVSMKMKLKKPITQPSTRKGSDLQNTDTSQTTKLPSTNALRVLNHKMDTNIKNNGTVHDENSTANNKESSTDSSDSDSSIDDSGNSDISSDEGKDSQPHVFGQLRKIENRVHKKQKLRSKKHRDSKKHHRERKHKKYKGHHRHGKHGKKRRHKFLQAYLKKNSHDRKKRIKHKLKQLKDKRIVGKNFEIAFDASSGDSAEKHIIDVTIVKRVKDGKRATISLVNKGKKFRSSDSSISSKEEINKNETTKKGKKSSVTTKHGKHKNKQVTDTTNTALDVEPTSESFNRKHIFRNMDHNTQEGAQENNHPESNIVHTDNSNQVLKTDATLSTDENVEIPLVTKDSTEDKITSPNAFKNPLKIGNKKRERKMLSPMLIQIKRPNKVPNNKAKFLRKVKNNVPKAQRRFFPAQIFNNSEYSDEEDELKKNLYDALRHKDELYYRRNIRHELPLKQELWEESDVTDEEIILKEKIYKAIKEDNRRSNHNKKYLVLQREVRQ